jgi:hypothetical protein
MAMMNPEMQARANQNRQARIMASSQMGRDAAVKRTPKKTRVLGTGSQMQFPGLFEGPGIDGRPTEGPPATKNSHSVPKRRANAVHNFKGGPNARVSNQPFLPGFNPRNAPGSAMDAKRKAMAGRRNTGIGYAKGVRAAAAAPESVGKKGILSGLSNMKLRTKIGIGLGLGVAASVAMNRRGEGVSPGRQSNARY